MSTYLRPAIAIIASLAVGASGAVLGASLATPEPVELVAVETESRTLPVIAPVGFGEEAPELGDADAETFTVSEAIAERDVPISTGEAEPETGGGIHLDDLAESDDIATLLGGPSDGPGGDPCAPAEGVPADEECPEGIRGALFSLTTPPEHFVGGMAYPQSREDYLDDSRRNGLLWCDTATGLAENEVPFGALTPLPATFTVQYWPTDDPTDVRDGPAVATSAEATAAWEAEFAASETTPPLWLSHCFTLTGVEPGTHYTARIVAVDIYDRIAVSRDIGFHGDGAPIRPSLVVHGISNLMFASAMHMNTQSVTIRAIQFEPDATPNCDGTGGLGLNELSSKTTNVSAETLRDGNILSAYARKLTQPYRVPEGVTILVCARWFEAGTSPSWERDQPIFQSEVLVQTPDRILPVVTLEEVNPTSTYAVTMTVSTAEGTPCAGGSRQVMPVQPLPRILCPENGLVHGGSAYNYARETISDRGFRGDLVLNARVEVGDDHVESAVVLPLRDSMCVGVCDLPPAQWFTVALPVVADYRGICGSSFGEECAPPSRQVIAGTVLVKVAWVQGETNGRSRWSILPPVDTSPEFVRPDVPQLDTTQSFTVTVDDRTRQASASFTLRPDRAVDYTVRLTRWDSTSAPCTRTGASLERSGRTDRATTIIFSGLCRGEQYLVTVELVDDEGRRAVWGLVDRSTWWGAGALIEVPPFIANLTYIWRAQTGSNASVERFELVVGHATLDARDARGFPCTDDGVVSKSGGGPYPMAESIPVRLHLEMHPALIRDGECLWYADPDNPVLAQTAWVDLDDLFSPEGVIVRFEDPYAFSVTLRARHID